MDYKVQLTINSEALVYYIAQFIDGRLTSDPSNFSLSISLSSIVNIHCLETTCQYFLHQISYPSILSPVNKLHYMVLHLNTQSH